MSIDWNTAPEGATHWEPTGPDFYEGWMKKEGTDWFYWSESGHKWINGILTCDVSAEREATFEARPQEAWNGKGLPPVGTVCIVEPHNTMWGFSSTSGYERKILAYYGEYVWLGHAETPLETTRIDKVDFRPLRTPEQIAAEEREKAVGDMAMSIQGVPYQYPTLYALFDAGYRRQEEGK
ncbi:hypothetical protein KW867_33535 [Pseudomonas aeruginosa]|uniref:hypothetical protein n=2 Tax=Pseudomonas aeruginosa TaxID=287 RepID=UPI001B38B6E0|nr:hypothetical protein [Pseudomonas aeruginosa]EKU5593408.1 hypothetical protein [Pseudomonas aeruginosa]MBQ0241278.1 hypothetical protein [Pseudomonas aeruginosa]MBQ0296474.1 hypothetical protein [Pseudomonas aeruginosa]MBT0641442.1 hypothetical protein [Pseudomonas aeruginosa]MBV7720770.1 hypothetical protein [Pseudomonas aeruginosa]